MQLNRTKTREIIFTDKRRKQGVPELSTSPDVASLQHENPRRHSHQWTVGSLIIIIIISEIIADTDIISTVAICFLGQGT